MRDLFDDIDCRIANNRRTIVGELMIQPWSRAKAEAGDGTERCDC